MWFGTCQGEYKKSTHKMFQLFPSKLVKLQTPLPFWSFFPCSFLADQFLFVPVAGDNWHLGSSWTSASSGKWCWCSWCSQGENMLWPFCFSSCHQQDNVPSNLGILRIGERLDDLSFEFVLDWFVKFYSRSISRRCNLVQVRPKTIQTNLTA